MTTPTDSVIPTSLDVGELRRKIDAIDHHNEAPLPWSIKPRSRDPRFGNIPSEIICAEGLYVGCADTEEIQEAMVAAVNAVPALLDRIQAAEARAEKMAEALLEGARWFDEYAELHLAKPDYDKAARNTSRAVYLRQALSEAQQ